MAHIDARQLTQKQAIETDICIIGGGAAGITLGLQFVGTPIGVCLLESGGLEAGDAETQDLSNVVNVGREYKSSGRMRFFGGNTNCWGGQCVPLRAIDLERRSFSQYSGWPLSIEELNPYYRRAHDVIGIGSFDYDAARLARELGFSLFPFDPTRVESTISRYNALRFGQAYRDTLINQENVEVYTHANVASINQHRGGDYVETVSVRTLTGNSLTVRAKCFVLATGGIENARLLLLSHDVQARGLGNQNDLVGRFFTEHIWCSNSGVIIPAGDGEPLKFYDKDEIVVKNGVGFRTQVMLPESVVRRLEIPNYRAEFHLRKTFRYTDAVSSVRALTSSVKELAWNEDFAKHVRNIIMKPEDILRHIASSDGAPTIYAVQDHVEQAPNPESRVGLSSERDALGLNRATVDWRLSNIDKEGIRRAHDLIAAEVGRSGFGRMQIQLKTEEPLLLSGASGGFHHMGTTRMHDSPTSGVVDSDCRIHGLQNMYVAGSSVFPTGGYPNPTLTIVALAIRLADHLKSDMRGK